MPSIRLSEIVPYSNKQMYDLVVDCDAYPQFLPWCVKGRTYDCQPDRFLAELTVSFKGFRESFVTEDRIVPNRRVEINLLKGPFKYLASVWEFSPHERGTRIDFYIDFKFKSAVLEMMIGSLFSQAARQMVGAFKNRAIQVYGNNIQSNDEIESSQQDEPEAQSA